MLKNSGRTFLLFTAFVCLVSLFQSCKVAKNLPEGQSLLVKNKFTLKIKAKAAEKQKISDDLLKIVVQKPNKRVFGFAPVRMWFNYSAAHSKKLNKFKQWIIDKVGEAPVVYDSSVVKQSRDQIRDYLWNYGYWHATVSDTVVTKNKKTTIAYNIEPKRIMAHQEVELPKGHTSCDSLVRANYKTSFLKRGDRFDVTNLKSERERIENICRNSGYFLFNREYVTFLFDSADGTDKEVTVKINLNHPNDVAENEQFYINNIYVISDYSAEMLSDTAHRDTVTIGEIHVIYQTEKLKKGIIADAITFRKNDLFSKDAEAKTINHLSSLGFLNLLV